MKILTIANREFKNNFYSRYLIAMIILLAVLGLILILISNKNASNIAVDKLLLQISSLSSLSIFLIPLMALFVSYEAIIGEIEQNTLLLNLSYPISRTEFVLGKYLGNFITLSIGIFFGYLIAVLPILLQTQITSESITSFIRLVLSSLLLAGCFISIGYLISAIAKQRSSAAGMAISVWLFFIVLFDLGLIGLLVNDSNKRLTSNTVNTLLMFNPVDIFRLISLSAEKTNQLSAMQALGSVNTISVYVLTTYLLLWIVLPLGATLYLFNRKQI